MMRLTDAMIRQWIAEGRPLSGRSDGGGLTFTMSAAQAMREEGSWVYRFRQEGRQKELTLGRYPELTLGEARDLAERERQRVAAGWDVATERQLDRLADAAGQRAASIQREIEGLERELQALAVQVDCVSIRLDAARVMLKRVQDEGG